MCNGRGFLIFLAIAGLLLAWSGAARSAEPAPTASDLNVVYIGRPGCDREKDFVRFLSQHFKKVGTDDLAHFTPKTADGWDVAILDYDGDGFKAPRVFFPPEYTRPTVTVGVAGGLNASFSGLKTGYL